MLEVIALTVADAKAAKAGGADRIELVGTMNKDGLSPAISLVAEIQAQVEIPIRVMLRTEEAFASSDPERLIALAQAYSQLEVSGMVLGYLKDGKVDESLMRQLLAHIETEYTFHRAIDYADNYTAAFADVTALGGNLTSILTAGSAAGVGTNLEKLAAHAKLYKDLMLVGGDCANPTFRC
ncbi:copper homeostasis protein CutC [Arcanobacterium hippocoleae]